MQTQGRDRHPRDNCRDAIRERASLLLEAGQNTRCRKIISDLNANLHQLMAGTLDESSDDSSGKKCTEILTDDLEIGAVAVEPTTTTDPNLKSGERLSAAECDASQVISVSGTVEWTLPGVDRKCHEPLVFTRTGNTDEQISVFVHEIAGGMLTVDDWIGINISPQDTISGGDFEIWWSEDQTTQYPEYVAFYTTWPKYTGCSWIGDDPEASGLPPVSIESSCP